MSPKRTFPLAATVRTSGCQVEPATTAGRPVIDHDHTAHRVRFRLDSYQFRRARGSTDAQGRYAPINWPTSTCEFPQAERLMLDWQDEYSVRNTILLLDQPTIVPNPVSQPPVENLVGSPVGLRYGTYDTWITCVGAPLTFSGSIVNTILRAFWRSGRTACTRPAMGRPG